MRGDAADVVVTPGLEWADEAAGGCRAALELLCAQGVDSEGRQVRVVRVLITVVDTTPDAVRAAAGMATADAFDARDHVVLVHDGAWHLRPAT